MANGYTKNTLLKFIYNELNIFHRLEVEDAIENDADLAAEYKILKTAYSQLPKVKFYPKNQSINNILVLSKTESLNAAY